MKTNELKRLRAILELRAKDGRVENFESLVRADEREAMVAEATQMRLAMKNEEPFEDLVRDIANAIRARGEAK